MMTAGLLRGIPADPLGKPYRLDFRREGCGKRSR